ncbi:MAG: GNAT family N-acetyltransferase [Jatrophihabitantaceae bacterium]
MSRRLVSITLDNIGDLPHRCRGCVFWELDPVAGGRVRASGAGELEKEAWLSDTLLEWGSCGHVLYVDTAPAGYILYAPAAYVPRAVAFATAPVSPDAVLLMTARLMPEFAGGGLGRTLVQAVARDASRRGIKAIEAFGRIDGGRAEDQESERPGDRADHSCLLPADYLLAVGFKTVRPHPRTPRLRLDLRSVASWREDVEYALDKLFSSIQVPALTRA